MKKINKLLTLAFLALGGGILTACDNGPKVVVGILQPVEHGALSAARKGFMEALKKNYKGDKKLKFEYKNANGVEADQNTLAKSLASKADLLLGIGTGASVSLKSAEIEAGLETPLLFTAVTDPVDAQLVSSLTNHGGFVTGTSDDNPVEAQVNLLSSCFPEKSNLKLGIIYTASEINSEVQANRAKEEAEAHGISVSIQTCTDSSDLRTSVTKLCSGVDAIYIPTDNNIAANIPVIKSAVDESHTLVIVGESNMLPGGGHITYSIDYTLLGKRTGEMAAQILNGEKTAGEIDCEKMLDEQYLEKMYSSKNLADANITLPASLLEDFTDIDA